MRLNSETKHETFTAKYSVRMRLNSETKHETSCFFLNDWCETNVRLDTPQYILSENSKTAFGSVVSLVVSQSSLFLTKTAFGSVVSRRKANNGY